MTLKLKDLARVHYNLRKKCFSVAYHDGKSFKVVQHVNCLEMTHCTFKVSKAGRERVLRTKEKNVHAFIYGVVVSQDTLNCDNTYHDISYNPYKNDSFIVKDSNTPIDNCLCVKLESLPSTKPTIKGVLSFSYQHDNMI